MKMVERKSRTREMGRPLSEAAKKELGDYVLFLRNDWTNNRVVSIQRAI